MDIKWFRIVSWHALRPDFYGEETAYCGRHPKENAERADDLPGKGKKCDSCDGNILRILEHDGAVG